MEVTIIRKVELSMDEQKKYEVIKSLADHPAPNKQRAALTLGCTVRHINRMLKGYKEHGKAYFIHGNRGRKPANTIPNETRNLVVDLYRNKYYDANFEHFTELLGKHEDIYLSPSAVMSILEAEYILSPKATKAKKKRIKEQLKADKKKRIRYRLILLLLRTPIPAVPEPLISVNCSKWTQLPTNGSPLRYGICIWL